MVQVQDAVKTSLEMLGQVFPVGEVREPRLEEVTLSDDEQYWLVTISFSNPDYDAERSESASDVNSLLLQLRPPKRRVAKTIKLRAEDGGLVGIKSEWPS